MLLAQQLRSASVCNEIKKLWFHGHATILLASELSHLFVDECGQTERFSQKDIAIASMARDILYQEFNNPSSVQQLSRRAGTNQFKLKKLFHYFFNNTPYGVFLESRMNKAYQLLESTHCHVNTAADFVGYQHASNFSTSFIRYFGVSPKCIFKKKLLNRCRH
jgi:AraC-like DNA-binding protein